MSKIGIYVDGSAPINVATTDNPAGWGLVVVQDVIPHEGGNAILARYGPVLTEPEYIGYIGAEVGSNNTAELSAIFHALIEMANVASTEDEITIYGDSQYAGMLANGSWKPKANKSLVKIIRKEWQRRQEQGYNFTWAHVRAHSDNKWNDMADEYANRGALMDQSLPDLTVKL